MTATRKKDDWYFNSALTEAKGVVERDGEHMPIFMGFAGKERFIVPMIHENDHEKACIHLGLKLLCLCYCIEHYIIIHEVWWLISSSPYSLPRPSEHPDRMSCLTVISVNYERTRHKYFLIKPAEGAKKAVLEEQDMDGKEYSGVMYEFLPPREAIDAGVGVSAERKAKLFKELLAKAGLKGIPFDVMKTDVEDVPERGYDA